MARPRRPYNPRKHSTKKPLSGLILIDQFSVADIRKYRALRDQVLKFHWDFYNALAYQRSRISDKLNKSLLEATQKNFSFEKWQRTVKYKYSLEPLSVKGSLNDPAGGRFNIGDINPAQFLPFPALYIAADKNTALQEFLSQKVDSGKEKEALDFALASPDSVTTVSLSGRLDSMINLNDPYKLEPFLNLLKDFSIPDHLKQAARDIGLAEPWVVQTISKLIESLLYPNWREWPMQYDIPVTSQIFGQLVANSGIEGILYTSKFSGKDCLAIFPQNFDEPSGSFIQLDDEAPKETKVCRWDAKTWREQQKGNP